MKNQVSINIQRGGNWHIVLVYILFIIMLPSFISLPFIIYKVIASSKFSKTDYFIFFIWIAIFIGSINSTKIPSGDQVQYYHAYKNVPIQGFWGSLINIYGIQQAWEEVRTEVSGEFMNGVYNYIGYYLTFGYYPLFEFLLTIANLLFVFYGLFHFAQNFKKPHIPIVCGALSLAFFYQYFNFMLHIQKQFLGQAIMMYVLGYYSRYGKLSIRLILLMFMSLFTHAANALFIPFLLFKPLRSKLSTSSLVAMSILFFLLILYGPSVAGKAIGETDTSAITYAVNRFADSEINNDGLQLDFMHPRVLITLLPIIYVLCVNLILKPNSINETQMFILNILLLLILAIFAMFRQPLAQYRYFMMTYTFIPFFLPFLSDNIKKRDNILKFSAVLSILTFFIFFENIPWNYAPEIDIIIKSPILLLFGDYYLMY